MYDYDNKEDVDDEPEVHHLDADVVPAEVKLHHEPSEITSEENIRRQLLNLNPDTLDPVKVLVRSEVRPFQTQKKSQCPTHRNHSNWSLKQTVTI